MNILCIATRDGKRVAINTTMAMATTKRRMTTLPKAIHPPANAFIVASLLPTRNIVTWTLRTMPMLLFSSVVSGQQGQDVGIRSNITPGNASFPLFSSERSTIVTNQAMGARCAVSADFDGDGRMGESFWRVVVILVYFSAISFCSFWAALSFFDVVGFIICFAISSCSGSSISVLFRGHSLCTEGGIWRHFG